MLYDSLLFRCKQVMFKRFLVMDLFHSVDEVEDISEWIPVEKTTPEVNSGIYKARLRDGREIVAYFCSDRCRHLSFEYKPTHWWDKQTKEPLYNVTHWGEISKKQEISNENKHEMRLQNDDK